MALGAILLVMLFSSSSRTTNSTSVATRGSSANVGSSSASTSSRSQSGTTTTQYISSRSNANIRSCPRTSCATVQSLASGATISTTGQVEGEFVLGSSKWTRILLNNKEAFVHSALVSRIRPSTTARPTATTASRSASRAPAVNPNQATDPLLRNCAGPRQRAQLPAHHLQPGHQLRARRGGQRVATRHRRIRQRQFELAGGEAQQRGGLHPRAPALPKSATSGTADATAACIRCTFCLSWFELRADS